MFSSQNPFYFEICFARKNRGPDLFDFSVGFGCFCQKSRSGKPRKSKRVRCEFLQYIRGFWGLFPMKSLKLWGLFVIWKPNFVVLIWFVKELKTERDHKLQELVAVAPEVPETWLAGKSAMNEDACPIEHGDLPNVMLVNSGVQTFGKVFFFQSADWTLKCLARLLICRFFSLEVWLFGGFFGFQTKKILLMEEIRLTS